LKLDRVTHLTFKYPEFPPRPIIREVVFSLMKYKDGLYFVNGSDEILKTVLSEGCGFVEDSALENNPSCLYKNVKPDESVKVDEYDGFYDLDFVLGLNIYIESNRYGKIEIIPLASKGGVKKQALLYGDGTTPRYVRLNTPNLCKFYRMDYFKLEKI